MSTLTVVDVSGFQHPNNAPIDWGKVRAAGVAGCMIKASQGTWFTSPYWTGANGAESDYEAAGAAGLLRGAYHYAEPWANSPEAEANYFLSLLEGKTLELGAALDFEELRTLATHEAAAWCQAFLETLAARVPNTLLYTNQNFFNMLTGAPWASLLWIADPSGTYGGAFFMRQTGEGSIDGIAGLVDLDTIPNYRGLNPGGNPPVVTPEPEPEPAPQPEGTCNVNVPELQAGAPGPDNVYTVGSTGDAAKACQVLLNANGATLQTDGQFGNLTRGAVIGYQNAQGLTPDGIVGPITWAKLVGGTPA